MMPTQAEIEAAAAAIEQARNEWLEGQTWNADIVPRDLMARAALEAAERVRGQNGKEIIAKLAAMEPSAPSEIDGDPHCFFCNAFYPGEIDQHDAECLWLAAKNSVK